MRASVNGPPDLLRVVTLILGGAIYGGVAPVGMVWMGAIHPPPVSHLTKGPAVLLAILNRALDVLLRVLWPISHPCTEYLARC